MIKLQVIGNLGKDCIQKEVNGKSVINFSVAHTEKYKDSQGNPREKTTWVECAYWTDRTGIAPYLLKGQMVFAEGTPEADGYLNKENQPAATLRMRVQSVQLLGNRNQNNQDSMHAHTSGGYTSVPTPAPMAVPTGATPVASVAGGADSGDLPF
jgi:single-strand DNA-binding protein